MAFRGLISSTWRRGRRVASDGEGTFYRADAATAHRQAARGKRLDYETKLHGYRALAFKSGGKVQLRSRNDNDFSLRYPTIAKALAACRMRRSLTGRWWRSMKRAGRPLIHCRIAVSLALRCILRLRSADPSGEDVMAVNARGAPRTSAKARVTEALRAGAAFTHSGGESDRPDCFCKGTGI